jgi:hypothetical protein
MLDVWSPVIGSTVPCLLFVVCLARELIVAVSAVCVLL